jgi:hypothetical protein
VLLYLPEIDPFLEDLAKGAERVFFFEERPRHTDDCQDLAENEGSEDLGGVLMIWSRRRG